MTNLNEIRRCELDSVISWIPPGARVLDVGSGTGAQAAYLASLGFQVTAVDIEPTEPTWVSYQAEVLFPVTLYDGLKLPFDSGLFEVVFSSYVLEHVNDVQGFLRECTRVLSSNGRLIVIVPTSAWRFWSIIAYYPARVKEAASIIAANRAPRMKDGDAGQSQAVGRLRLSSFFPSRHGEVGSPVSELWWFARWRWRREFMNADLVVLKEKSVGYFTTGEWVTRSSAQARRLAGRWLGSAGRAYLVSARATGSSSGLLSS